MSNILIKQGDRTPVTWDGPTNYKFGDFHVGGGFGNTAFNLNLAVVAAIIVITRYYNLPKVQIKSTRRTPSHNAKTPHAADKSRHIFGDAVDFAFLFNSTFGKEVLHQQFKKDIQSKGELYQRLYDLGIREFFFYKSFNHIALEPGQPAQIKDYSNVASDVIKTNVTPLKITEKKVIIGPPVKEFYEYYYQDSRANTISLFLDLPNCVVSNTSMNKSQFLNYKGNDKSNLDRIWDKYTNEQKYRFSSGYANLVTQELNATTDTAKDSYIEQRKQFRPTYDNSLDYEINTGTLLVIPKNLANIETLSATGKDLFMVQQDLKTFLYDEYQKIANDPTFVPTNKVKIKNSAYSINYQHITFSCWLYVRALDKIVNISPFVKSIDTVVGDGGGTFSISINDIFDLDSVQKYSETLYSYVQKTQGDVFEVSFFKKIIQQNDIVFIRYERLDIETDREINGTWSPYIEESELPNKIYDMIGLVDVCSETYSAGTAVSMINFSGRDLTKLIVEDGSYFIPFAMVNGGKEFFLNYNPEDSVFKRLFSSGEFMSLFTALHRTIRDSVGFIFNQLTNVGILPKGRNLFSAYGDRQSKAYAISKANEQYLDSIEVNGIWKIIKVVVDNQLDDRRLNNGELSSPEGAIRDLISKVCQEPFVEFWGDTLGDQFVFMARQPPFTKEQILDYWDNNLVIDISADQISDVNLNWEESYFTWYQLQPLDGLFGSDQFIAGTAMPIVYFEEYANLFGMHKKVVSDAYISYGVLSGDQQKTNIDLFRQSLANDLKFVIESNSVLPFTRKGTITISGGDRRIKKGTWVWFKPTDELCYVRSVTNSCSVSGDVLSRVTQISVDRCMKIDYLFGNSPKQIDGKDINYFDIINIDVILEQLQVKLADNSAQTSKTGVNQQLVNPKLFDFFSKRQQWQ